MRFLQFASVFVFMVLTTSGLAQPVSDYVTVDKAFARAVAPGMSMSGAFMTITNHGDEEHFVVSASSDAARNVELHAHTNQDGMMRMRQVAHFHLKPGKSTELRPGGLHIMLMKLQQPLAEGTTIQITLQFSDGSSKTVNVPVKSLSAMH